MSGHGGASDHEDAAADHGEGTAHDEHAHGGEGLGPIDWAMWTVGALGVVVGLIVAGGFVAATGYTFSG